MSGQLPLVSSRKAVNAFRRLGFEEAHTKGSHLTMRRPREDGREDVTVLVLAKTEMSRGTLRSALRLGNVSVAEFLEALR